jgi:hypothetical protein
MPEMATHIADAMGAQPHRHARGVVRTWLATKRNIKNVRPATHN